MLTRESDNNGGRLFDPIDRIGNWHNNSSFSDVHTQSPRTTSFGGGANGGMDDRFDWLFVSESILNTQSRMVYIDDSYTAFGNDGNHFNNAINSGNNFSVSEQIADALHDASDHLPVYMDVWFDDLVFIDRGVVITEIMANPSSVSDSYGEWFEVTNTTDTIISLDGWTIKDNGSDMHLIQIENQDVAIDPGQFFVFARSGNLSSNGGVVSDYVYSGFSLSNTEDEMILMDSEGAVVDEVQYDSEWNFSSGISKEIHEVDLDNNLVENWFVSTISYGSGDYGTPGYSFEGSLGSEYQLTTPDQFIVHSLFPNPFNSFTTIRIFSDKRQTVVIQTFDLFGRELERKNNISIQPGFTELQWEGKDYPSSIYFLKISSSSSFYYKKLILLK